jgi:3-oxocholest-4-en-26-oyl-CoA dehydrogenase alpha subunit
VGVHLALGEAGYLAADYRSEADGGFSAVRRRIWELEIGRAHTPWSHWGTTATVAHTVERFAAPELTDEVLPGVLSGRLRLCLGYAEPEGGSDVATCKTRAVREADGSAWLIDGSKMFTSNAHNAHYVFLITNTDPSAPKHKSLTMFLLPLDAPGVEIQPLRTVDGDRTNITLMVEAVDGVAAAVFLPDASVAYRLGRGIARMEAAMSTPAMFGRVAIAQTMRDLPRT